MSESYTIEKGLSSLDCKVGLIKTEIRMTRVMAHTHLNHLIEICRVSPPVTLNLIGPTVASGKGVNDCVCVHVPILAYIPAIVKSQRNDFLAGTHAKDVCLGGIPVGSHVLSSLLCDE